MQRTFWKRPAFHCFAPWHKSRFWLDDRQATGHQIGVSHDRIAEHPQRNAGPLGSRNPDDIAAARTTNNDAQSRTAPDRTLAFRADGALAALGRVMLAVGAIIAKVERGFTQEVMYPPHHTETPNRGRGR